MFSYQQSPSLDDSGQGDARRAEIISVTETLIAQKGFEGLRIRDIADQIGVNNGTIHYYFKTKDILIKAVVEDIVYQLVSTHDPDRRQPPSTPAEELEAHLHDIQYQIVHLPQRFTVLSEVFLRASRDEAIHTVLQRVDQEWLQFLDDILQRGIDAGEFRPDLDVRATRHLIMMVLKGTEMHLSKTANDLNAVIAQILRWVRTTN